MGEISQKMTQLEGQLRELEEAINRWALDLSRMDARELAEEVNRRLIVQGFVIGRALEATPEGIRVRGAAKFAPGARTIQAERFAAQLIDEVIQ